MSLVSVWTSVVLVTSALGLASISGTSSSNLTSSSEPAPQPPSMEVAPIIAWGDFNGDGRPDIYAIYPGGEDRLLQNNADGTFTDVTVDQGLAGLTGSRAALWADFDRDGALDVYVVAARKDRRLFKNDLERGFIDVTASAGLTHAGEELDAAWLDYDGDTQLDLALRTSIGDLLFHNAGRSFFDLVPLGTPGAVALPPTTSSDPKGVSSSDEGSTAPVHGNGAGQGHDSPPLLGRAPAGSGSRTSLASPGPGVSGTTSVGGSLGLVPPVICSASVTDQAAPSNCIQASSTPTLGTLYPMTTSLNVSASGNVGVGTSTPSSWARLDVDGNTRTRGYSVSNLTYVQTAGDHPTGSAPVAVMQRARNTWDSPQPVQVSDVLGACEFGGYNGSYMSHGWNGGATILAWTAENWTPTAMGTDLSFTTTPNGGGASVERMRIGHDGNVGIGTSSPSSRLDVAGDASASNFVIGHGLGSDAGTVGFLGSNGPSIQYWGSTTSHAGKLYARTGGVARLTIDGSGNVGVGTESPTEKLDVAGVVKGYCVTITGGCDLAEPFETVEAHVEPGMVVCIDPERDGELTLSKHAYDTTVVGVISGAGSVKTGMTMSQTGVLDEGAPVALTGRVYAWCDASYGAIKPGDLLTSSDTPGHAMKVTDRNHAAGAMLGKAMSSLDSGKGLVLIVVALQ